MVEGLGAWWHAENQSANVQKNLPNLAQYRPDGMGRFVQG